MAMIKCHECRSQISSEATSCPICGVKPKKPTSIIVILGLGFLIISMIKCTYDESSNVGSSKPVLTAEQIAANAKTEADFQAVVMGAKVLKNNMKNPASFELESALQLTDGTVCYRYRSTNSFNAVVPGVYIMRSTSGSTTASDWNKYCAGKTGTDQTHARQALKL